MFSILFFLLIFAFPLTKNAHHCHGHLAEHRPHMTNTAESEKLSRNLVYPGTKRGRRRFVGDITSQGLFFIIRLRNDN